MDKYTFLTLIATVGLLVWFFRPRKTQTDEKIIAAKGKISQLENERKELKEEIIKEHKDVSEEKKQEFWNNYLEKKDE